MTGTKIKITPALFGLSPGPVRDRLQWSNQAIVNDADAVTTAPCIPNVVESDAGSSAVGEVDKTSVADVYDGALCSFSSCDATIT